MYRTCIAVVDASRARLFTHERTANVEGLHDQISETQDLVNPARRLLPSQLFSGGEGSNRTSGLQYGLDDHRDGHVDELDVEFSREVVDAIRGQLAMKPAQRLVVCASPRMLGRLREVIGELRQPGLAVSELPRNLVKLTVPDLRDYLTSQDLLPPRPVFQQA